MQQDALVAIDVGDLGFAGGGGDEAGIVGEQPFGDERADINDIWANGARVDGECDRVFTVDGQTRFLVSHYGLLMACYWRVPAKGGHNYRVLPGNVNGAARAQLRGHYKGKNRCGNAAEAVASDR